MSVKDLFDLRIDDGYSFRNMIGIFGNESTYITFQLFPDEIVISFINKTKCATHRVKIKIQYFYNFQTNGELDDSHCFTFETDEMFKATKGIGKRDGIKMFYLEGDKKIHIQHIKHMNRDLTHFGALFINIVNSDVCDYKGPKGYSKTPNISIKAKEFADICGRCNTLTCSKLEICGNEFSVKFEGIHASNKKAFIENFASQSNSYVDEHGKNRLKKDDFKEKMNLSTVVLPIQTVKALSKIHNVSPSGSKINFYFQKDKPIKLESKVGTYGVYKIYIRNYMN